jgi:hypothetical protein
MKICCLKGTNRKYYNHISTSDPRSCQNHCRLQSCISRRSSKHRWRSKTHKTREKKHSRNMERYFPRCSDNGVHPLGATAPQVGEAEGVKVQRTNGSASQGVLTSCPGECGESRVAKRAIERMENPVRRCFCERCRCFCERCRCFCERCRCWGPGRRSLQSMGSVMIWILSIPKDHLRKYGCQAVAFLGGGKT